MTNPLEALQGDFKLFLTALWEQLDLPPPTRAQFAIADYLQHGPKRLQIQAFRGVGKSWITGAFVLWTLFNDPERKIMICLLYTSPSPRDVEESRMPSSA